MNREQTISRELPTPRRTDAALDWLHPCRMNDVGTRPELGRDIDCGCEPFRFQDLPRRKGLRPATLRGPLHIQCNGHGDLQYLDELTTAALSWPYVETEVPDRVLRIQSRSDCRKTLPGTISLLSSVQKSLAAS